MTAIVPVTGDAVTDCVEYVAVTVPLWIVYTWKFGLFAAVTPSVNAPPADGTGVPPGFTVAMFVADSAMFAPSGTTVPSMSRIFVIVIVELPGVVALTSTVDGFAVIVAECATY